MEGWIRKYRKELDNPVVCKDSEYYAVWNYLLLNATHKEIDAIFKGKKIRLKPGQLITGRKSIAEKFNIDDNKVQRILKAFENEHQIEQQTSTKNRLISIVNWNKYQNSDNEMNNKCTTNEQQMNTNNNEINNNINNNIYLNTDVAEETKEWLKETKDKVSKLLNKNKGE